MLFILYFTPLQHHGSTTLSLTHLHVCAFVRWSPTAPLRPSSLAWILSWEERFLLVFGIPGNTSFHEELSVYGDCVATPTPHSSPFPYITLKATTSSVFFSSAYSLHIPCYSKRLTLIRSFKYARFSLHLYCWPFATVINPNINSTYTALIKSLYTLTTWPLTARVYWAFLNWPIHFCMWCLF